MFLLSDVWIDECCVHNSLWRTSTRVDTFPPSIVRLKMLHRTLSSATLYIKTLLQVPQDALFHLGLQIWAGWMHIVVVICKLIFLEENERLGQTNFDSVPQEIENLNINHPNNAGPDSAKDQSQPKIEPTIWDPLSVALQYEVPQLFDRFTEMLRVCHMRHTVKMKM